MVKSSIIIFYAHTPTSSNPTWHDLFDHSRDVAALASEFAEPFGARDAAERIGLWHDAGKAGSAWQAFIRAAHSSTKRLHGPNHSSIGMLALLDAGVHPVLALLIACHHTGLRSGATFKSRIARDRGDANIVTALHEASIAFGAKGIVLANPPLPPVLGGQLGRHEAALGFRMLHSCLVDADCLDTERHMEPARSDLRDANFADIASLWDMLATSQEMFMQRCDETPLNLRRARMYRDAVNAAAEQPGFFSLSMPTGAGKTRTGMAFALRHAVTHEKRRVVVAIPFTSIIEQNAQVYRDLFGDENVLEHHSAVGRGVVDEPDERERRRRLIAQNWDAPIVVTTNVQLFESLFSNHNGSLRKLHNIVNSVIVLDEAQTLPLELLYMTLSGLRILVECFGCTVVFSTATQPAFRAEDTPNDLESAHFLEGMREIIMEPREHYEALLRVTYELRPEPLSWEEVVEDVEESGATQALIIVNTIMDAHALLDAFDTSDRFDLRTDCVHLSTRMCSHHRERVLADVRHRLERDQPCILVSTQVVEAGVDLDFPRVWRAMGPLEAIVQAAGRCNREGLLDQGTVVVFETEEGHCPPGVYAAARDRTARFLSGLDTLDDALCDPSTYLDYFRGLYNARGEHELDKHGLLKREAKLDYEEVAKKYRLIDDDAVSAVVAPPGMTSEEEEAQAAMLADLRAGVFSRAKMQALRAFCVNIRRYHVQRLLDAGLMDLVDEDLDLYEWRGDYDDLYGIREQHDASALIIGFT